MPNYLNTLLALTGVLLLSVASPGPNFVIVTSTAVASRRSGVMTGLGLAAASGTWALIAIAGLSLIVAHLSWVDTVLRIAGATYLIWLGIKMIATARRPSSAQIQPVVSGFAAAKKGYVVSMTNPKSVAFYGSIFAVMMPAHAPTWLDIAAIGLAMVVSCTWYCGMALLVSHEAVRGFLVRRKAVIDTAAGVVLISLGGRMIVWR